MSAQDEIRQERLRKRNRLVAEGHQPYAATSAVTHSAQAVLDTFAVLTEGQTAVTLAGRVMSVRRHGGSCFADLFDGSAKIQIFLSRSELGETAFDLFDETIDPGDFIEVHGIPFTTKRGTPAISAAQWSVLTKAIQNIPTEHFGIRNDDERYRQRHLDLLLNNELRDLFVRKQRFWSTVRHFMISQGFMEVETPTLEITTGGAEARPFQTYHHDFAMDVYLRISVGELWQKRLMAAGYQKTFEIGRIFRNEGSSPEHLQEFTNAEFYWAYADYRQGMGLVKELYRTIAREVFGTTVFTARGHTFDLAAEWREIDYIDEIKQQTGVDIMSAPDQVIIETLQRLGVVYDGTGRERLIDTLWKYCRKQIAGPAFLVHHPVLVAPLAKTRTDGQTVEMFQPLLAGSEVGRGYSELNDPIEQAERFRVQQQLLEAGDEEAMMPDWEFVEMLEHGMPPTCGFGFGERLFAFLAGQPIRETQLFPLMKPRSD